MDNLAEASKMACSLVVVLESFGEGDSLTTQALLPHVPPQSTPL